MPEKKADEMSLPATHFERMDLEEMRHRQAKELAEINAKRDIAVAKEERKAERSEMWMAIGIAAAVAGVLFSLIYAWWIDVDPKSPEDFKTTEAGREQACIERGGGWVPEDLLASSNNGLCVFPGKQVEVPSE